MANIAALVSGGVDSSVALNLALKEGHNITAFYLKIWLEDELSFLGDCPWEEDMEYVEKVCQQAGVPLQVINLQKEYWDRVVSYTIQEVKEGHTPNPDVMCNSRIKFGAFLEKLAEYEKENDITFDKIITGHYANTTENDSHTLLKRTPDPIKDQTYFLANMSEEQLQKALFPLAPYTKEEVRQLAQDMDLPTKWRKDSQGICFLGQISWKDFLKYHLGEKEGEFKEFETDKVIGTHQGFWFYTIGQRNGLDLNDGPWYVVSKDAKTNTVYVSTNYNSEDKNRREFEVLKPHWTAPEIAKQYISTEDTQHQLHVKLRHGPKNHDCKIVVQPTPENPEAIHVKLTENDQGIASGQFAVFYTQEGLCIGCGPIR